MGDFVEADEGESVAVGIAEAGGDAAPDGSFFAEERGFGGVADLAGFGVELDAAEARSVIEADAAFGPFLIFGEDVFGDESQAGGAADEFEVERVGLGGDEGEDGLAVGRSDGDEAFAGLELGVVGEVEAELVDVEAEAAVLVADVDVDGVDAEVGGGIAGLVRGRTWGDYKARRGAEVAQVLISRPGPPFGVRPHDILRDKRLNDCFSYRAPKVNALWMEIVVGAELKRTILFDLYVNYGSRNSSAHSSNDFLPRGWLQWNNYKILLWPRCVSLEGIGRFSGGAGNTR